MQSARDVDARADIWSLGAILFEMLANRPPYQANTLPQLCQQLLTADPPKLRALRPEVPEGVEGVVARCLMRNINERWQEVKDISAALKPYSSRHQSQRPEAPSSPVLLPEFAHSSDELDAGEQQPGTLDPWGNTQARKQRSKNRLLVAVPLALLAVGMVAALWVMRSKVDSATSTNAAVPEISDTPVTKPKPTLAGAGEPKPEHHSTPGTIVTPVDSSEVAEDEPPDAGAAHPPVPVPRPYIAPRPFVPVAPVVAPAGSAPSFRDPPETRRDPAQPSNTSDFGGRR